MRDPYRYGLPGDVSFHRQNRIKELFFGPAPATQGFGCAACPPSGATMRGFGSVTPIPAGHYAAPLGKTVRGLGALVAMPISEVTGTPVMRAAYEMGRLGYSTPIQMAALGDAVADRQACLATTGALVGGSGVAQQQHTASGGTDQGWSTGIGIFSALATTAHAMCNTIQTGQTIATAPPGPTPPPLPSGTTSMPSRSSQQPAGGPLAGIPTWALIGGTLLAGGLVAAVVMR